MHHYENHNTTYTVDICKALGKVKDAPADEQCPNGTQGELLHSLSDLLLIACHFADKANSLCNKAYSHRWQRCF